MFNTLSYAKKLEEAGIPREQAEVHIQIIAEIVEGDVATKADLMETRRSLETSSQHLGNELRTEMHALRTELKNEMATLEYRLTIKLGAFMTIGFATMTALLKFFLVP